MPTETELDSSKEKGWYTAFYRFAEYLRLLTDGAINHKSLYALVGLNGRYINSENALIRKRNAATLSRLLHSSRYAADFRERHDADPQVFDVAARRLAQGLVVATDYSESDLVKRIVSQGMEQLRLGLLAEGADGRSEVNGPRLISEMTLLESWSADQVRLDPAACLRDVLKSCFSLLTYGHLEDDFAKMLVDASPTDVLADEEGDAAPVSLRACVMRAVESDPSSIENMWAIGDEGAFLIGRYVDCDAIETNGRVSRRHCRIFRQGDCWYVQDEDSRYGTAVRRNGQLVWESGTPGGLERFPLAFGDCLVLAGEVHYWFVSLQNVERLLVG